MSTETTASPRQVASFAVRPLRERDLTEADRVMRVAFGTFLGMPEPIKFMGTADYVRSRWSTDADAAFGAFSEGELIGSNFATNWGSFGFFGPLTIRPDHWDRGVGTRLLEPALECFDRWGTTLAGLFTFANSPKHIGMYEKFGFAPRFLTAIMSKPVGRSTAPSIFSRYSGLDAEERAGIVRASRALTDRIHGGLDVSRELVSVATQGIGESILLCDDAGLAGLAICHYGPGSEAESGVCYVKFGAARPGPKACQDFVRLLDACENFAMERGLGRLVAGMSLARTEAYSAMRHRGFRTDFQGVAMHRGNDPGFSRPGVFVVDDWR